MPHLISHFLFTKEEGKAREENDCLEMIKLNDRMRNRQGLPLQTFSHHFLLYLWERSPLNLWGNAPFATVFSFSEVTSLMEYCQDTCPPAQTKSSGGAAVRCISEPGTLCQPSPAVFFMEKCK